MKKYLPALLVAILSGMTLNSAFAADTGDVDAVTMDVIDHSDPHAVTNDIQLPDDASQVARDHVAGTDNDSDHAQNAHDANAESHDSAQEDANEDSHSSAQEDAHTDAQDAAQEDAHEDSQAAAQEQAHQAMQDAADAATSKGD